MSASLTVLRRKRGVVKRSVTNLLNQLRGVEAEPKATTKTDRAKQLITRLEALDKDFRTAHLEVISVLEEDSPDLEHECTVMDKHEDDVADASLRLQALLKPAPPLADASSTRLHSRKLSRIERCLKDTETSLEMLDDHHDEVPLLEQHQEKLADLKKELHVLYEELIALDLPDGHDLLVQHDALETRLFNCSHRLKKLLSAHASRHSKTSTTAAGVEKASKLPKLDVPTFDGDVLHWQQFWEQFEVSIHSRRSLSDAEKLVYLQQAIKGGSAQKAIVGLSQTGDQYREAIECLKARYNRPRLIHRAHVRTIVDVPSLREGDGKELRHFHDVLQQHLRALRTMKTEPDPSFVTSIIELKLDQTTLFEWQKHSQSTVDEVPHYQDILDFLDLRAQACETLSTSSKRRTATPPLKKSGKDGKVTVHAAVNSDPSRTRCVVCSSSERHPLYACPQFKTMSHDDKRSVLKRNNLCLNCFSSGHYLKQCKSTHRCRKCQRPHHTLLHVESEGGGNQTPLQSSNHEDASSPAQVVSNAAIKLRSSSLLMTCRVLVFAGDGSSVEARALLDNGSTSSFVSERLVQILGLPRSHQDVCVSGIAGSSASSPVRSITSFQISSIHANGRRLNLTAIVLPKVTCNLPVIPVSFDPTWTHLSGLPLADPTFGEPRRVDLLLGVEVFVDILRHGRRSGPAGSPIAVETDFGWVLCGGTMDGSTTPGEVGFHVASFHTSVSSTDDLLRKFWEVEEPLGSQPPLSPEERFVVQHFLDNHSRSRAGRFVVPLPRRQDAKTIGESRSQATRRFLTLERSLRQKARFQEVDAVMKEYLDLGHAEVVSTEDLNKDPSQVFYLPMHVVYKSSSSTTKVRAVFDASAKSSSGVSLNDTLVVGPTVHPPLVDVLLRFRLHRVGLTADVSKMYRAIELIASDRDFHRFVWRSQPDQTIVDYRMTRATFGVSASCFAANMAVKHNAVQLAHKYPQAAEAVRDSFYVDDGLMGADSIDSAIALQRQLQDLFTHGGFLLRKWNSSEPTVLHAILPELRESQDVHPISDSDHDHTKTLGLQWDTTTDTFRLTVSKLHASDVVTKRTLVSDIAKIFDALGWFSPAIVSVKILLQRVWEERVSWDDPVPETIQRLWLQWRSELPALMTKTIPRCYFPDHGQIASLQIHGFSDASEDAYGGVVYLRMVDSAGAIHTSLVMSKTKVSPIKRLSIPRLELCGAQVLANLLNRVKEVLRVPLCDVYAWTDSTIVLNWLIGNPRRFKTYVGNRVSHIVDLIGPERWGHVDGTQNPADCASRGLLPAALLGHELWWTAPDWLRCERSEWPKQPQLAPNTPAEEGDEICHHVIAQHADPVVPFCNFSSFNRLKRVTAWILRFISNCKARRSGADLIAGPLMTRELRHAEDYWTLLMQQAHFSQEIWALKAEKRIPSSSPLVSLNPFLDDDGMLRVGGREANSGRPYDRRHPLIIHAKHPIATFIIRQEHLRLLHAGPSLLITSLSRRYHLVKGRSLVRSVTRACVTCRRGLRPQPQMMGQLPAERVTAGSVFDKVGVDYAGPVYTKMGSTRKPTIVKSYVAVFVSLSVKAVHLEAVSDLTTEAFLACLRRFAARRGKPAVIWSDHGTNFIGAARLLSDLHHFLRERETEEAVTDFCSTNGISWEFIPEKAPHFGGLWEAAVKSMKKHLHRIVGNVNLRFEELSTVLCQIEACLNSRPLTPLPTDSDGHFEVLTPGHFIIGRPIEAIPDSASSDQPISSLRCWNLCQALVKHFWRRWSAEYLVTLQRLSKWRRPSRSFKVGDVVLLREDTLVPMRWPVARVVKTHTGQDGLVRVAEIKTNSGTYTRPANKLVLLLPDAEPSEP